MSRLIALITVMLVPTTGVRTVDEPIGPANGSLAVGGKGAWSTPAPSNGVPKYAL